MTTDSFVERIISEYERTERRKLKAPEKASAREFIVSDIPGADLLSPVKRKLAAVVLHKSLQRFTDEPDDDWGEARNFKDIYDCRVCANAVAQVFAKGILEPMAPDVFGMTEILCDWEAEEAVLRLFDASKRVTNLLGFKNVGN